MSDKRDWIDRASREELVAALVNSERYRVEQESKAIAEYDAQQARIRSLEKAREADRLDFCRVVNERDRAQVDLLHVKMALFGEDCDYSSKTWQECVSKVERTRKLFERFSSLKQEVDQLISKEQPQ